MYIHIYNKQRVVFYGKFCLSGARGNPGAAGPTGETGGIGNPGDQGDTGLRGNSGQKGRNSLIYSKFIVCTGTCIDTILI